jgi:hypothetical protein
MDRFRINLTFGSGSSDIYRNSLVNLSPDTDRARNIEQQSDGCQSSKHQRVIQNQAEVLRFL